MDCVQSGRMFQFQRVFPGDLGGRGRLVSWILLCVFHFLSLPAGTGAVGHNVEWNEVMEAGRAWIYDATLCKTVEPNCINSGGFLRNCSKTTLFLFLNEFSSFGFVTSVGHSNWPPGGCGYGAAQAQSQVRDRLCDLPP